MMSCCQSVERVPFAGPKGCGCGCAKFQHWLPVDVRHQAGPVLLARAFLYIHTTVCMVGTQVLVTPPKFTWKPPLSPVTKLILIRSAM